MFAICVFFSLLIAINVSAQEGNTRDEAVTESESAETDPIIAAEQALVLEDSPAGTAALPPAASALSIFRVLLTLAVVAAAIYGLVFFIKKASRSGRVQDPFLKVLASTPLGTNRSAHIISVGSQAWLVGAAENGVNLIGEIDDKDVLNTMLLEDSRRSADTSPPSGRFPDFKALLGKLGMSTEAAPPDPEKIRKRRERLKGL